jgi:hypothetical protein
MYRRQIRLSIGHTTFFHGRNATAVSASHTDPSRRNIQNLLSTSLYSVHRLFTLLKGRDVIHFPIINTVEALCEVLLSW